MKSRDLHFSRPVLYSHTDQESGRLLPNKLELRSLHQVEKKMQPCVPTLGELLENRRKRGWWANESATMPWKKLEPPSSEEHSFSPFDRARD